MLARWCATVVVLLALIEINYASYSAGIACNMCRMERTPPLSSFPDGFTSCAQYYPSAQCPLVDSTSNGVGDAVAGICQTDPYAQECPKKEQKKGQKYHALKRQGTGVQNSWTVGSVICAVAFWVACIGFCLLSCNRRNASNPVVITNVNVNKNIP